MLGPDPRFLVLILSVLATVGLLIAVLVGMALHGPVRWVRLCTVGLVVVGFIDLGLIASPLAALGMLGFTALTTIVSTTIAILAWSTPAELQPEPHPFDPPDPLLRTKASRWTGELEALGFQHRHDLRTSWSFGGQTRRTWIRVFTHPDRHGWVEIAVLVQPKLGALRAVTPLADGRTAETSNRRTDAMTLGDRGTLSEKVPENAPLAELLLVHDGNLARAASPAGSCDELPAAMAESHRALARRLQERGTLVLRGDGCGSGSARCPGCSARGSRIWCGAEREGLRRCDG